MYTLTRKKVGFIMAFTMGLTDLERQRAKGFLNAFLAELKPITSSLQVELTNDSYPELRIIKPVQGRPLIPTDITGSAAVIRSAGDDYECFCSGVLTGCRLLSEAVERTRAILQGEIKV